MCVYVYVEISWCLEDYYTMLHLSYSISSSALESPDLLLYSMTELALHNTIILIVTPKSCNFFQPLNHLMQAVSENMSSLHLDVHEDMGICGPMYGMCEGAVTFCACCHGAMNLWCPEERSTLEMIMSFRDQSVLEAIGNCMSGSRHSRNADDDESSDSRNPASNNSDRNEHHN